jgi:hypothetical protein
MSPTPPIYLVCGFPRSGTSMMMRAAEAGGLPCVYDAAGDARRNAASVIPDYAPNPHGFYELDGLQSLDWAAARGKVVKVVQGNVPLLPRGERYRAAYMRRDPAEIRRSYVSVAGPLPHPPAAFRFLDQYDALLRADLDALAALPADVIVLDYAAVVADPRGQFARLGWPIDAARAAATVDPALYRHRGAA